MKRAAFPALFVLLLLVGACGDGDRTSCELGREHLDQCNAEIEAETPALSYRALPLWIGDDCSGENACLAGCVKDASCDAISWVSVGSQTDPDRAVPRDAAPFAGCVQKCLERFGNP